MTTKPAEFQRLADLMVEAKIAIALRAVAEYSVADLLANGSKSAETLAEETGLSSGPLRRILRVLTQFDVFKETTEGHFENTGVSAYLKTDTNSSLREAILFLNSDVSLGPWLKLEETLKDGQSRFVEINGAPLFKRFGTDAKLNEYFGKFMTNIYGPEASHIAAGYPFGQYGNLIDVGGGQGHILAAILTVHEKLHGTLFDIKSTAQLAQEFFKERGFEERCQVVGGDFFDSVPKGYDAYMLKSVIHDWDDDKAIQILSQIRRAMSDDSHLLLVEEVIVPGKIVGNTLKTVDLEVMIHLSGQERTEREYASLFKNAGFKVDNIVPIKDSFFSVIEGTAIKGERYSFIKFSQLEVV